MGNKVLVVDDSMVARMAIKGALKDSGASFVEAASGEEALGLVESGLEPDLVFLDLTMPGIGGVETLRAFNERHAGLRVIVVTADVQSGTMAELASLRTFDVLRKPADRGAILSAFERATRGGS